MRAQILRTVRDYYTNPIKYVDESTADVFMGRVSFHIQPLHTILGVAKLGSGHFSAAFALNENWVLKLDLTRTDPAYEAWADYCMENPANPWLPRIRAKFKIGNRTGYIIERLDELPMDNSPDPWESEQHDRYIGHLVRAKRGEGPACPQFMRALIDFGVGNFTDLYRRNVMIRKDGQLVITDPCHEFNGRGYGSSNFAHDAHVRAKRTRDRQAENARHREKMGMTIAEHMSRVVGEIALTRATEFIAPIPRVRRNISFPPVDWGWIDQGKTPAKPLAMGKRTDIGTHDHHHLLERANADRVRRRPR